MSQAFNPPTPELQEYELKQRQLSQLETQLVDLELEHLNLGAELKALEEKYLRIVGTRYAELDQLEAQIAALQATLHPTNEEIRHQAQEARAKAAKTSQAAGYAVEIVPSKERMQPSEDLKKLYREVAKRIHPDLAATDEERVRRTTLMAEANTAYEAGDEALLHRLLENAINTPEEVIGEGIAFDLIRLIRKISQVQKRIAEIQELLKVLKQSSTYDLKLRIENEAQNGRHLLEEMRLDVGEQILQARRRLTELKRRHI